jgi:hypothetical protein
MKIAHATLKSVAPYSQSRAHETPKLDRETSDAHEVRTWREKTHTNPNGHIFIPPMSFKQSLDKAAQQLGLQIPGKGKSTYTKFFRAGVLCVEGPELPITKDQVQGERIHANSDGVRGSGKRVWRWFPTIPDWTAEVSFHVLANEITKDVFEQHLSQAGSFVGIGRFRPENGGYYGRFKVERIRWEEV